MKLRIGQGYDVHQLAAGVPLVLGGVPIPHTHGLKSHSDGDALTHALCDALLGALSLRDIGYHFSDKDPANKGRNSLEFLRIVMEMVRNEGYEVSNIDVTVILEAPKVNPHVPAMKQTLCETMSIRLEDLSIKATTSETLGFVGRREGISVFAVALLYKVTESHAGL
ncbi:MAG: 2-C-methyl-D-erythritol 2,4-cyclodiphosphate synthase [Cytophagales bacterium]|nr:2-C-methyl-D-erythritol 2,4-cyclodiphosphate synthase [Cytophagales bacterium]